MSPLGIQRLIAFIIFFSPWIFVPGVFKDIVFIIAGIFLFISTLDMRKKERKIHPHLAEETERREGIERREENRRHEEDKTIVNS